MSDSEALVYDFRIYLNTQKKQLEAHVYHQEKLVEIHTLPNIKNSISLAILELWFLNISKDFLYRDDFDRIDLRVTIKSPEIYQKIGTIVNGFVSRVQNTQAFIKQYRPLFQHAAAFDGHLFYNVDHLNTFEELHREMAKKIPEKIYYENSSSGWNKVKRIWENSDGWTLDQLVQFLLDHRIKHIFSVNMYYLVHLIKTAQMFPLPFFKAMGVEWICIDYDTYDLEDFGFLQKSALTCPSFRRFSMWPHLTAPIDKNYQNKNIRYFMEGDVKPNPENISPLKEHASLVVISQARIQNIFNCFPETIFFLEQTKPEEPYLDFQMLYYVLINILYQDKTLSTLEKEKSFSYFSRIYVSAMSFLKYDVIQALVDNKIQTKIYGDEYWNILFPEIYQNKFLNEKEMENLFKSQDHLYLLLNQNYSYFENNPVFLRALNLKTPYLCFSSLVRTDDLEGMKAMEYKNSEELIQKLMEMNNLIKDKAYLSSLKNLCAKISNCRSDFHALLLNPSSTEEGYFNEIWKSHEKLLGQKLQHYLKENHERIFLTYDKLIDESAKKYPIEESRFRQKTFFSRLIDTYSKIPRE